MIFAAGDTAAAWNLVGGALAGLVVAAAAAFFIRHKTKAETTDLITQAAERIVKQFSDRNTHLERQVSALWRALWALSALVRQHGGDPTPILQTIEAEAQTQNGATK